MDLKTFKNAARKSGESKKITEEEVRNAAKTYEGKNEEELLADILSMARENKANGTLSAEQLKDFEARVSPILNAEQKERLRKVLGMLGN
ncbi:MAG: hypothetical protein J6Y74_00765 [Clostridia bacterium]|nr:hypothetical protein [Clostridia bacterium]